MRFSRPRKRKICTSALLQRYDIDYKITPLYAKKCVAAQQRMKTDSYIPTNFDHELFAAGLLEKGFTHDPFNKKWSLLLRLCWPRNRRYPFKYK